MITCIVPRNSEHGKYYMELGRRGGHRFYSVAHFYTVGEVKEVLESLALRLVIRPWPCYPGGVSVIITRSLR